MTDWAQHIGDFVCWNHWHGVLQDVFVSPITGETRVQIYFVKNAYKRQGAETIPVIETLRISTREEIKAEIAHYNAYLVAALRRHIPQLKDNSITIVVDN